MQNEKQNNQNNLFTIRNFISLCILFTISVAVFYFIGETSKSIYGESSTITLRSNNVIIKKEYYYRRNNIITRGNKPDTRPRDTIVETNSGTGGTDETVTREQNTGLKIFFTSYNPLKAQTDDTPCIGAIGEDLCQMSKSGIQPIALSRDLIWGTKNGYCTSKCPFSYGDVIRLKSDIQQCNLIGQVVDTMNKRYTLRGDIFYMDRSMNTSCEAEIVKLSLI